MAEYEKLSVGGYLFLNEKDAGLAETELKKIEYLEARIDYSRPERILTVYEKSIHERIFRTPVGFDYLQKLRDYLLEQPEIDPDAIPDIELYCRFSGEGQVHSGKKKKSTKDTEKTKQFFKIFMKLMISIIYTEYSIDYSHCGYVSDNVEKPQSECAELREGNY